MNVVTSAEAQQLKSRVAMSTPVKTPWWRRHPARWFAGSLALVALITAGFFWWRASGPAPVLYVTAPASNGAIARTVSSSGTVNPVLTIIVGTYVSGVIQNISCDYNTQVTKGQLCAKIDPRPYQTAVDQARAVLATAEAQLIKDNANLAYAKLKYGRTQSLAAKKDVSEDAVDISRNLLDQAEAQSKVDAATVRERKAALSAVEINLGYTDIVSPVNGTVVSRNVTVGQTVAASFQTPTLFLIAADLTKMQIDTNVSESDIGPIREGNPARFTVESFPGRRFEGTVTQVRQAPQTVQNVVTYDVIVSVNNPEKILMPGMTATMRIVTDQREGVLRIPNQALRYSPSRAPNLPASKAGAQQNRVWVLRDGQPTAVEVTTGLDDDANSEITGGGLKRGDLVILGEHGEKDRSQAPPRASAPRLGT